MSPMMLPVIVLVFCSIAYWQGKRRAFAVRPEVILMDEPCSA